MNKKYSYLFISAIFCLKLNVIFCAGSEEYAQQLSLLTDALVHKNVMNAQASFEKMREWWADDRRKRLLPLQQIAGALGVEKSDNLEQQRNLVTIFLDEQKKKLDQLKTSASLSAAPFAVSSAPAVVSSAPTPLATCPSPSAVVVRGGIPLMPTSPRPAVVGGVVLSSPRPTAAAAPRSINVAQQMMIEDALKERVQRMRKQGQAIMRSVKGAVDAAITEYFNEKKIRNSLSPKELEKIDIEGLQARVNGALSLGTNFFVNTFGK